MFGIGGTNGRDGYGWFCGEGFHINCGCKHEHKRSYKCFCGKVYGTEQGLKVHKWMNHKNMTKLEEGE